MPTESRPALRDLLTSGAAAQRLGIPQATFNDWVEKGYIAPAATKPSGHRLYSEAEVDRVKAEMYGSDEVAT